MRATGSLLIIHRADIGPDCLYLLGLQRASPWRHLIFSIENRIAEPRVVLGPQTAEVECHRAACIAQLVTVAGGAIIGVKTLTRGDLAAFGGKA